MAPQSVRLPRALTDRINRPNGRPEEWFLGSLQARAFRVLTKKGPSTVREVTQALQRPQPLAYTTVMTVLGTLFRKGIVVRTKRGKGFVYEARYTEEELRTLMARHLIDELVDDFGDVALASFATALDGVDRRRLRALRKGSR